MGHHGEDEQAAGHPHGGHARAEEQCKGLPFFAEVLAWELDACDDELDAEDEAREVEGDGVEGFGEGVVGVGEGPDEVCRVGGEDDTRDEGDY